MRLVALVRTAAAPDEAARALASATGLTAAEARMRLAPEPPAILARLDDEPAGALVAALRRAGLAVLAVDLPCPTDRDRVAAVRFDVEDAALTLVPRAGDPLVLPWAEISAILRGLRSERSEVERSEKTKRFSATTAVATGGLKLTRTSTKVARSADEKTEQVLLVYARDGRAATLAEGRLDFASLGPGMLPSSTGNMAELARRIRERATAAFYDERLLRLGRRPLPFLGGGDARTRSGPTVTTRTDTSGTLDVLAEVMRQAVAAGLLR